MRIPFISAFMTSPFEGLLEHAEKIKECTWAFQQAIECHITDQCESFEEFRKEVDNKESEADAIKRRIRGHLPKGTLMPVDKFELFRYLHEQDKVLDAVEEALDWISFRAEPGIPDVLHKDFFLLIKKIIHTLRQLEHEADKVEDGIKAKVMNLQIDPVTVFHMIRLAETIGSIADHAENAGDMMRAMLAR
jgi:uncharacterized protein Yka (UPF0111/DUF47 family)